MRILAALATLLTSFAAAADSADIERHTVALALDLCGGAVAQDPASLPRLVKRLPGLVITSPQSLARLVEEEEVRSSFIRILHIEDATPVQVAAFDQQPSAKSLPYALLDPDGAFCVVVGAPARRGAASLLRAQLDAPGSSWRPLSEQRDGAMIWERPAAKGENITLGASWDEEMIIVSKSETPTASNADISVMTRAVLERCVAGVLAATPSDTTAFSPMFTVVETGRSEENPKLLMTTLRAEAPAPRSLLRVQTVEDFMRCELFTSNTGQTLADLLGVVISTISAVPDAREVKARTRGKDPELRAWRIKRRGASRYADISVAIREDTVVSVTIEHATGWLR